MDMKKIGIGIVVIVLIVIIGIAVALTGNGGEELQPAEFEVSNITVSDSEVNPGETVTVSVEVTNVGEEVGSHTVELTVDGESFDSEEVEVDGGQTETVTFQVSREEEGVYDLQVSDLSQSFEVAEEVAPAEFEVSNLSISPEEIEEGKSVAVSVDVSNVGEDSGVKTVEFEVDGVTETVEVEVDPGETESVQETFTLEEAGEYSVEVEELTDSFEVIAPPTVSVDYEVVEGGYLSVRVKGPEDSYEVLLFDPEGEGVGTGYISSDDMIPGHETVEVMMADVGENPDSGEYELIVQKGIEEEHVFEANPTFEGHDTSIKDVQLELEHDETLDEWDVNEVIIEVSNDGDLPIFLDGGTVTIGDEEEDIIIATEEVMAGETVELEATVFIMDVQNGDPVNVEIYSEEDLVDTYETTVEIE